MRKIKIMDADGSIKSSVGVRVLAIYLLLLTFLVTFTPSDSPGGVTVNGSRQELWAVTNALPTSGLKGGDYINSNGTQFTFPTGSPLSMAGNNIAVRLPYVPPANTLGIWVYMEIDGVEQVGMFIGWMAIASSYVLYAPITTPLTPNIDIAAGRFMYFSRNRNARDTHQFPANTVIKIYRAGI